MPPQAFMSYNLSYNLMDQKQPSSGLSGQGERTPACNSQVHDRPPKIPSEVWQQISQEAKNYYLRKGPNSNNSTPQLNVNLHDTVEIDDQLELETTPDVTFTSIVPEQEETEPEETH